MKIGVTGAGGFIGGEIVRQGREAGHEMIGYTRRSDREIAGVAEIRLFRDHEPVDVSQLDALIHLSGESVLGLWTAQKRKEIRDSRILSTRRLVAAMGECPNPPRILVSASATGFYGDTGDETRNEASPAGEGFLSEVCQEWEREAQTAIPLGIRVVHVRIGFVLGKGGESTSILARMFRLGLGGNLGNGRQWMPWIHVSDVAGLFLKGVTDESMNGAYNATAPGPVRNAELTRAIAEVVRRPAFLNAPGWAIKLFLGELSEIFLLSQRVLPVRTMESGFPFRFCDLQAALRASL